MLPTYLSVLDNQLVPLFDDAHYRRNIFLSYRPDLGEYCDMRAVINWLKAILSPKRYPWFSKQFIRPADFGQ